MTSVTADLLAKVERFHLVIAPSSKAFGNFRQDFIDACDTAMTLEEAVRSEPAVYSGLVIITGVEKVEFIGSADGGASLGVLRKRVNAMIAAGSTVVLLSAYPKIRYPEVPGSSILHDACDYHPPLREISGEVHRLGVFPAWDGSEGEITFLTGLVDELGAPLVARLDQILFESPLHHSDVLSDLSSQELSALYFAGLVCPAGEHYRWSIPNAMHELKEAVANSLAGLVTPPRDLSQAYETLWKIERRIRAAIRARAIDQWDKSWKDALMHPEYFERVLDRAGDVAYPGVAKIGAVRDPLDWLTLGELLALREQKTPLGNLGMNNTYWRRLAAEVMPIRNQVSHMRLIKPGDYARLRQWEAILRKCLPSSPALDHDSLRLGISRH